MSKLTTLLTVPILAANAEDWRVAIATVLIGAIVEVIRILANKKKSVQNEKKVS